MASLYKKRGNYFVDYWVGCKRKSLNTQLKDTARNFQKAQNIKADIELEVEIKKIEIKEKSYEQSANSFDEVKEQLTMSELLTKYRIKLSVRSKSHQELFEFALVRLMELIPGDLTPREITSEHIISYIKLLMNDVSNATLITYLNYLKAFFNYLVDEGYILKSPIRKKDLPKRARKTITTFQKEMLDRILEESKHRDYVFYCILKMLGFMGIRPVDLMTMKVGDLDIINKVIIIRMSKTSKEIKYPMHKELHSFITEDMKSLISINSEDLLFPGYSVPRVGRKFRRIKVKLGITEKFKYTLKTFRKTFATLYAKTLHIQDVAYLLGHDDVKTTRQYYADVMTEDLRQKMNEKFKTV